MKPADLRYMFSEMVQRTEQLFFSIVEVTDNRFINLPSFLTALASIVREMDDVSVCVCVCLCLCMCTWFQQAIHDNHWYMNSQLVVNVLWGVCAVIFLSACCK